MSPVEAPDPEIRTERLKRRKKVTALVSDEMHQRLGVLAVEYGHSLGGMASFAVSSWIVAQERAKDAPIGIAQALLPDLLRALEGSEPDVEVLAGSSEPSVEAAGGRGGE